MRAKAEETNLSKEAPKTSISIFMDRLTPGSFPKIAGKEAKYFEEFGFDADLLLIKQGIPSKYNEFLAGLKINCLNQLAPLPFRLDFKIPKFSFFSFFHLTAPIYAPFVYTKKDTVLVSHATYTCFTALALKKIRKIPYIAFIHDPITYVLQKFYHTSSISALASISGPLGVKIDKVIADNSEAVVLPSKFHLDFMKKITKKPVEVVYAGADAVDKIPNKRGDYFLAVARWELGKKPYYVLDILERLIKRGIRPKFVMVGTWKPASLRAEFANQIKKRGLTDQVQLLGVASEEELSQLYLGTRGLVHFMTESFGMIGLEAAAHGAPVIIPEGSGVTDLFCEGVHGFFPAEGDLDAYSDYVGKLFSDERLAWKMGLEAWNVAKIHTWESHVQNLKKVVLKYA